MLHRCLSLALVGWLLAAAGWSAQAAPSGSGAARVIVKFKATSSLMRSQALSASSGAQADRAQAFGRRVGLTLSGGKALSDRAQVMTAEGLTSQQLATRLAQEADVEYAVPDERRFRMVAPNDPLYATGQPASPGPAVGQWYLRAPAGEVKSSIDIEPAWAVTTGSPSIVVAVLDTGVRFDHVDLQPVATGGKLLPGYDMISDVATANDGDGRDADPSDPGDWITAAESGRLGGFPGCTVESSSWHGTQTAGLVGALTNNGIGMASAGRDVRVLPVRVLGKCGGLDSDILAGMRWAAGIDVPGVPHNPNPARVINMSLGSSGTCSQAYKDAITDVTAQGVLVVSSAGNSEGHAVSSPANCPGIVAVAGLRHIGTKVGFSDLGTEIAISAPGGNCLTTSGLCAYPILTTTNTGTTTPVAGGSAYTNSTDYSVGTSFSAPLVSATAALMLSAQPALTPASLRTLMASTARPFPTTGAAAGVAQCHAPTTAVQDECYCTTSTCGAGMLDAGAAVRAAAGTQAVVSVSATPTAGQVVTLDAAASLVQSGRTIVSYQWTLVDGGGIVTGFTGATNAATAAVTPTGAGRFIASLTITDDQGRTATASQAVDVVAAPLPPTTASSGGGGGGAMSPIWLMGLAAAVFALRRSRAE